MDPAKHEIIEQQSNFSSMIPNEIKQDKNSKISQDVDLLLDSSSSSDSQSDQSLNYLLNEDDSIIQKSMGDDLIAPLTLKLSQPLSLHQSIRNTQKIADEVSSFEMTEQADENQSEQLEKKKQLFKTLIKNKQPFVAKILLSPIKQYNFYRILPCSAFLHILLLILVCLVLFDINRGEHVYSINQLNALLFQFLDDGYKPDDFGNSMRKEFYKVSEIQEHIDKSIQFYKQYQADKEFAYDNIDNQLKPQMCELIENIKDSQDFSQIQAAIAGKTISDEDDQISFYKNRGVSCMDKIHIRPLIATFFFQKNTKKKQEDLLNKFKVFKNQLIATIGLNYFNFIFLADNISETIFGNDTVFSEFVSISNTFSIKYDLVSQLPEKNNSYLWLIEQQYDFKSGSIVSLRLQTQIFNDKHSTNKQVQIDTYQFILAIITLFLSILSLFIEVKNIFDVFQITQMIFQIYSSIQSYKNKQSQDNDKNLNKKIESMLQNSQDLKNNNNNLSWELLRQDSIPNKDSLVLQNSFIKSDQQKLENKLISNKQSEVVPQNILDNIQQQNTIQRNVSQKLLSAFGESLKRNIVMQGQTQSINRLSKQQSHNQEYITKLKRIQNPGINQSNSEQQQKRLSIKPSAPTTVSPLEEDALFLFMQSNRHYVEKQAQREFVKLEWSSFLLIVAASINIFLFFQYVNPIVQIELRNSVQILGVSCLLYLICLNRYLLYDNKYAQTPDTLFNSSKSVLKAIIGILPIFIAFSIFFMLFLGNNFRFRNTETTLFTIFYMLQGDTYSDTGNQTSQQNFVISLFFYFVFIEFSIYSVMKVALAQVEEGYLDSTQNKQKAWLCEQIIDPLYGDSDLEKIKKQSLTIPDAIKRFNIRKQILNEVKDKQSQRKQALKESVINIPKIKKITDFLEVEEYLETKKRLQSKRYLLDILAVDEITWHENSQQLGDVEGIRLREAEQMELSELIAELIELRLFLYQIIMNQKMASCKQHLKLMNPEGGRDKAVEHLYEVEDELNEFIDELLEDR